MIKGHKGKPVNLLEDLRLVSWRLTLDSLTAKFTCLQIRPDHCSPRGPAKQELIPFFLDPPHQP